MAPCGAEEDYDKNFCYVWNLYSGTKKLWRVAEADYCWILGMVVAIPISGLHYVVDDFFRKAFTLNCSDWSQDNTEAITVQETWNVTVVYTITLRNVVVPTRSAW